MREILRGKMEVRLEWEKIKKEDWLKRWVWMVRELWRDKEVYRWNGVDKKMNWERRNWK